MGYLNSILFIILSLNFYQSVFHLTVEAKDVRILGDEQNILNSTSTLVSPNGLFNLGFFTIPSTNLTYLGIWYNYDGRHKPIIVDKTWVANRDIPILGSGVLMIDESGTLKVIDGGGTTLFNVFYNQVGTGNTTRAVLEDSGNFLVYDEAANENNRTLWQSFDYPTDTLLAGMKLGYNLTTKQNWTLTTSLSDQVPASGAFTMRLEKYQNTPQLLIYLREKLYWASGPWTSLLRTFKFFELGIQLDLISDPTGLTVIVPTFESKFQLSPQGRFLHDSFMLSPDFCYGYQSEKGCAFSAAVPNCRAQIDSYHWESGEWIGGSSNSDVDSSIGWGDCMERCWNDCNCRGFSTFNSDGTGCITWVGDQTAYNITEDSGKTGQKYVLVSQTIPKTKSVLVWGDESTSKLVSANGKFTLGFFKIPSTGFTYLGIWPTRYSENQRIWVGNRDKPMIDDGVLTIDDLGSLLITGPVSTIYIYYNYIDGNDNKTKAVLEDSGNFLVYDSNDKNNVLWQSFDHPTDTLIDGMKIGYNLTIKQNWTLTSSLNDQFPASGAFTMRLEIYKNSPQLLIYRHEELYWASGPWNNNTGTFQLMIGSHSHFPYDLISDPSGMYLVVRMIESGSSTLLLSPQGQFFDNASTFLSTPDFCYGYQSDDGCAVSETLPSCRSQIDSFQLKSGVWINGSSYNDDNSSISLGDCMERCWNDCNCLGFTMRNTNGTECITWKGDNLFKIDESGQTEHKYILVSQKPPPKKRIWMWILVSMAILLTSSLTTYFCYARIRIFILKAKENRRRDDFIHQLTGSNSFNYGDEIEKGIKDAPDIKIFSLKALLVATDSFSQENKLGQGGYGPVYKGKLSDGREIAIKRLSKTSGQGIKEFKNELILISKLQHTNLVRLYGCCIHKEEKMLIYELMPNKSLDFFLFAEDKKENLDWQIRFNIIEGVAQGLLYLHKYSRMRVIHRDLKVSNILLDVNMNPKIADFGMARIFQQNVTEAVTKRIVGTYGYMAPEYAMQGTFSIKSDVFSFGVLILEIISGKKNSSFYNYDMPLNLVGYTWKLWKRETALELKDETLGESFDMKQLLRSIHIGLLCVQENADDRPTMSEVMLMLHNEIVDLSNPKQPAFFTQPNEVQSADHLLDNNIQVSINTLTVTTMSAR